MTLFQRALACLQAEDADQKPALTHATADAWRRGELSLDDPVPPEPIPCPGLPAGLRLVSPRELRPRKLTHPEGRAALLHAIAHIEFSAINLAWDAAYRFRGMPRDYYDDWVRVADEEARHFQLLRAHLRGLGWDYGDFPAHNGLWEMARKTADDHLGRMAMVPRGLEARGLDVTPGMMARLQAVGDARAVEILEVILREEIGHVAIGSRWFRHLCEQRGLDPEPTYRQLLGRYFRGGLKGPFNHQARIAAGFSEDELAALELENDKKI